MGFIEAVATIASSCKAAVHRLQRAIGIRVSPREAVGPQGHWYIAESSPSEIDLIYSAEKNRCRIGQQDLTTVPGGHHPRGTVEHRPEVIPFAQFGFAGRDAHPDRQLKLTLCSRCRIDSGLR